jgi:urocanate hydratase
MLWLKITSISGIRYVDIMGPMCFDYGFGPFRWVCASGEDLQNRYNACQVLEEMAKLLRRNSNKVG